MVSPLLSCQGILVIGFSYNQGPAFDALAAEGYQGIRMANSSAAMPDIMALPALDGVLIAAPQVYNPQMPYSRGVNAAYEERNGRPLSLYSAMGYEAVMLTAGLLQEGKVDRASFKASFEQGFVYPGLFGNVSNAPGSHDLSFPLYPARVENRALTYMGR